MSHISIHDPLPASLQPEALVTSVVSHLQLRNLTNVVDLFQSPRTRTSASTRASLIHQLSLEDADPELDAQINQVCESHRSSRDQRSPRAPQSTSTTPDARPPPRTASQFNRSNRPTRPSPRPSTTPQTVAEVTADLDDENSPSADIEAEEDSPADDSANAADEEPDF